MCVPEGILAVSCGTTNATNVGKTDLLSHIMSLPPTALERNRSGIFHPLSVDLVFGTFLRTTHNVVAADIHGFDSTDSGFLAVVWLLMSASALVIFHVTADDFGVDGKPVKEVEKMIRFANDSNSILVK